MTRAAKARAQDDMRWQQRKAAATREAILRAALDCLVDLGYSGLTTIEVTKRARISRGAMHHHFANRAELIAALIDHVLHRRLDHFLNDYLGAVSGAHAGDAIKTATELHWQSLLTPEYTAYLELAIAARTDPDLAALLVPATRAFDAEWMEAMKQVFPQWEDRQEALLLAHDLATAAHVGLLVNRSFMGSKARREAVRDALVGMIDALYEGRNG